MRAPKRISLLLLAASVFATPACVGKFLSTMLSNEGANFKLIDAKPTNNTTIRVSFNKPLSYTEGALDLSTYNIPGLDIKSVAKGLETHQVLLYLDPASSNRMDRQYYTLSVGTVKNNTLDPLLPGAENRTFSFMGVRYLKTIFLAADGINPPQVAYSGAAATPSFYVRGDYAVGQVFKWKLVQDPGAVGSCSGAKIWDFNVANFVAAPVTEWSANINSGTVVNLPALPTQDHEYRLCGQIQDAQGAWQLDITMQDFSVTSTPPLLLNLINPPVTAPNTRTNTTVTNISVSAPVYSRTGNVTSGQAIVTNLSSTTNIVIGMSVTATEVPGGTRVLSVDSATQITLTANAVATAVGTGLNFSPKAPAYYAYRTRFNAGTWTAWGAQTNTNQPINISVAGNGTADGTYDLQVLSRDLAGNWECDIAKVTVNENDTTACYNISNSTYSCSFTQYMAGTNGCINHSVTQQLTWVLDTVANNAVFDSNTLPAGVTAATSLSVDVLYDSVNTVFYQYRITGPGQSGAWSGDKIPMTDRISAAGLGSGLYKIEIVGRDQAGNWQSTPVVPSSSWSFTVDLNAPTAVLTSHANCLAVTGLPPNPRSKNCFDITVGGTNVDFYAWKIETGPSCVGSASWNPGGVTPDPTGTPVATPLTGTTTGVDGQTYSLCVIGRKSSGPYQGQSDSDITKLTFKYDTTPPQTRVATWLNPASQPTNTIVTDLSVLIGNVIDPAARSGNATSGSASITGLSSTADLLVGMSVSGTGIPAGTFIATIPSGTQITLSNNATQSGTPSLTFVSEAVLAYKGDAYSGACPSLATIQALPEQTIFTPIQKNSLGVGTKNICFIGRDAAGNYEPSVRSATYTVFAPATPADGGGANDSVYANNFNFTWAAHPSDATEVRIRVCSDAACVSPLPGLQNGIQLCSSAATCAATTSYNFKSYLAGCSGLSCIHPQNGANYYAQLRVTDASGNISNFGAVSNGKVVTGGVTGAIRDTNGNTVSGATVGLYNTDVSGNCSTQIGSNLTTGAGGTFTFNSGSGHTIPIAQQIAGKGYCVQASTTGPTRQGTKKIISVDPAIDTNVGSVYVVDTSGKGCLYGAVVDGSAGSQLSLSNATFTLKDWNGNTISGNPALDPDGRQFYFPAGCITAWGNAPYNTPGTSAPPANNPQVNFTSGLTSGVYSLDVSIPGYYNITESAIAVTANRATNVGYLPMVGTFNAGSDQIKVILTWGGVVQDLDLHVVGVTGGTDCIPYNATAIQDANNFHVYTKQRYCDTTPASTAPVGKVNLAVDSTMKYGPEIMNFYTGYTNGTYKFSVFNNDLVPASRSGTLTNTQPTVTGLGSTADLLVDMSVSGTGIPANTKILSVDSASQVTLTANATTGGAQTLSFGVNWTETKARIQVYAGSYFTGTPGLKATIGNHTSSTLRGWKPFKFTIAGTTLTIDDSSGASFGYADWQYGINQLLSGQVTNGSNAMTGIPSTAGLAVGWTVTGTNIQANTTIASISSATAITLSLNATGNNTSTRTFGYKTCRTTAPLFINGYSDGLNNAGAATLPAADPKIDCGLLSNGTTTAGGTGPLDW